MAADVEFFFGGAEAYERDASRTLHLRSVETLFKSRGAKAAMAVALRRLDSLHKLISMDNAPADAALASSFAKYCQGMRRIEDQKFQKHIQAEAVLEEYEPSLPIRQFLLTNLTRKQDSPYLTFRVPLVTLQKPLDVLAGFPFHPDTSRFEKLTLFVRGTKSH